MKTEVHDYCIFDGRGEVISCDPAYYVQWRSKTLDIELEIHKILQ